ncbi:MAG: dihydrofolate reductase family protein, partial [Spirochaetota bacterium]
WLRRCLDLALGGLGRVAPNPLVGAVLVRPRKCIVSNYLHDCHGRVDDFENWQQHFEILGEGYHVAYGQAHAEARAFADALRRGYGPEDFLQAVLYCNLEPCSFRTTAKHQPPCCEEIIRRQVGAVVFANHDPNPAVDGTGVLRRAGLAVRSGDFALPSARINQIFFRHMGAAASPSSRRPWVSLKFAQSLDGCIATKSGHSRWISGPAARAMVQALRASHGAICSGAGVGRATLEADDPGLLLRPEFLQQLSGCDSLDKKTRQHLQSQQNWRIVWDSHSRSAHLPLQFYCGPDQERSIVVSNQVANNSDIARITVGPSLYSAEGLREALTALAQAPYHMQHLLIEGGAKLAGSFLANACVDEVYCFISQRFIGKGLHCVDELQPGRETVLLPQTLQLRHSSSMPITERLYGDWDGPDEVLCHGYLRDIVVP